LIGLPPRVVFTMIGATGLLATARRPRLDDVGELEV